MENAPLCLGLDLSTQQLKAIVIDDECKVVANCAVNFALELPQFGTENGVCKNTSDGSVTSPVDMWLCAIDLLFAKLSKMCNLSAFRAISGCAQQHGTVYWSREAEALLGKLDAHPDLTHALKGAFSLNESPIWMDSSTSEECDALETALGGPMSLATVSGSRAFHRFSASQIMKIFRKRKSVFGSTERISLISSFVPTVLCGKFVGIDEGDAGGMNLMNVKEGGWASECLNAIVGEHRSDASRLEHMLGPIVPSASVQGLVAPYFANCYGISNNCEVVAFTGDNLSSLAGLCLRSGDIAVSLGTSDTVFMSVNEYKPALEGHLFRNPVDSDAFMAMLCFKNGAFTRDRIRKSTASSDWRTFSELLQKTPPGNNGNIGFYFDFDEIVPNVRRGDHRFNSSGQRVGSFEDCVEARAVLEHQSLAKRLHAEKLGYRFGGNGRMLVTGGASGNLGILQILSDVFNCDVFVNETADSAALGGALRARHVARYLQSDYSDVSSKGCSPHLVTKPIAENVRVYNDVLPVYARLEATITSSYS